MGRSGGAHDLHEMFVCLAFGIGVSIYATHVLLASYNSPSQKWRAIFISSPVSFRVAFLFEAKNEKLSASFFFVSSHVDQSFPALKTTKSDFEKSQKYDLYMLNIGFRFFTGLISKFSSPKNHKINV